ncbi:MAG: 2-dehydropantoate 2-reductase [Deltaproteobacteria bacterium HGW-Deltaproteobacteria-19]|jgi:2-dehydropantoate 2-reductase|nr:MAG: 2-dehydropantoate 2-reductase [Deltaproteobacteria bacterium HGW-Deltaproteobacteria-19]
MKVAILGAGSLGTISGALITKNGGDVVLIDANREHVEALNKNGATITGKMDITVPVKAITPDAMSGEYDLILYLVKQTYNESALKALVPHLHKDSIVCTLQNGVPEDAVAAHVGREKVMGCAVGWGATWLRPGVSELTSESDKMTLDVGELDGTIRDRTKAVAAILEKICPTEITTNLPGIRWSKLLINATLSGMSAALGCTFGEVLDNEKALACVALIGNETIAVVHKLGVALEKIQGADLNILAFQTQAEMAARAGIYKMVFGPHRLLKASMLQDIEKGLKTEIDAINGIVCENGRKTGVPTPINDTVVSIVKGIEQGKYKAVFDNLSIFQLTKLPE